MPTVKRTPMLMGESACNCQSIIRDEGLYGAYLSPKSVVPVRLAWPHDSHQQRCYGTNARRPEGR